MITIFYLINLFKDINLRRLCKRFAKDNARLFEECGFRCDWIGRYYCVVNVPKDVPIFDNKIASDSNVYSHDAWDLIYAKLSKMQAMTMKNRLQEVLAVDIQPIDGYNSLLVMFKPITMRFWFHLLEVVEVALIVSLLAIFL